jgi:hypothetical protein
VRLPFSSHRFLRCARNAASFNLRPADSLDSVDGFAAAVVVFVGVAAAAAEGVPAAVVLGFLVPKSMGLPFLSFWSCRERERASERVNLKVAV